MSNDVKLDIRELKPGFGAEVTNVDIPTADAATRAKLVETFHHHGALLLRNQKMTPDELLSYLSLFGEPEGHTLAQYTLPGYPNIYILSNREENGRPIGAHNDGVGWHTDYSYKEEPVQNTMLYALEVPPTGSDTLIADCCAAYNALTPERQKELDGLVLHHSYKYFMENREYGSMKLSKELEEQNPDVFHPLIRTHPADGRKALWVSTGTVKEIVGMPNPEGLELIDELVDFVTQEKFTYRHKWQVGDVLTWDNRCTLHTGTVYDDEKYYRVMHRLWAKGDKPY
ncbi:TauD/TfdA dioxygenase family protein [Paremcibacter congregatus]|uniref:Taurine dioxygenase n=1 Tax=Paremcibacter congregatus TaxID=2043170 RepID=A0A2G4YQK0_9PROT|nr:TauD/TfdA family dioxygenase [Paremcibacter congregatus]PHZ84599.1 taurine dioxygenase [Paremcibacter congregatus]QDE28820.1 TauD/TfdA family dioxygenase [Paremcibacter congregatus]|tara:strand:+ start:819 stop:1673 length:855 start_codon:yes stop_codon:yes gene_type:complete